MDEQYVKKLYLASRGIARQELLNYYNKISILDDCAQEGMLSLIKSHKNKKELKEEELRKALNVAKTEIRRYIYKNALDFEIPEWILMKTKNGKTNEKKISLFEFNFVTEKKINDDYFDIYETVEGKYDQHKKLIFKEMLLEAIKACENVNTEKNIFVIKKILEGYTQVEIAKMLGVSKQAIDIRLKQIRKRRCDMKWT